MKLENGVRVFAGVMILASVLLVAAGGKWWLLFTAFVGVSLIQSAFTGICPAAKILKLFGMRD